MRILRLIPACLLLVLLASALWAQATDEETKARLEALRQAVAAIGRPPAETPAVAEALVCACPHGQFSPVGRATEAPFGTRGLAARWHHDPVDQETVVTITWTYAGSQQPLSQGTGVMPPGTKHLDNGILKPEGPLLPGVYEVRFEVDGIRRAGGKLTIAPPEPAGERGVEAIFQESLQTVQEALRKVDAAAGQAAGETAARALPGLGTVLLARPADRNAQSVYELAQAVVAVGKMEALAPRQQPAAVLDWALRGRAHARRAQEMATDGALRSTARQFADTLEQALPRLRQAAP